MRGYTYQAAEGSFSGDEGAHGIFHPSIAALYDGIGFIGILAEVLVHELKMSNRKILQSCPVLCRFFTRLVKEVKHWPARNCSGLMLVIRIRCPGEIMNILRDEMPCQ